MKVWLNGEQKEIQPALTLKQLLESLAINPQAVVVERNESVIYRRDLESTSLAEGDKIEIVHFVGGGSADLENPADVPLEKPSETAPKKAKAKRSKAKKESTPKVKGPKNLVIVESPAKAKTINKFLGSDYHVEASMGHVRDLPKSKMGIDVAAGFKPDYIVMMKARKTVKHLKKMAKDKEGIFLAPDPDREGEAISWHLAHIFGEENGGSTIQRVVFNEITKDAVQEAFRHPREIEMNLVNAQQARRILDRIVGYELSPLLWRKVGRGLSAGRVQSVALRLIVDREKEIKAFVPQEYWSLEAKLSSQKGEADKVFLAKLDKINNEKAELNNREQTEAIRQEILGVPFQVSKVDKHERRRRPHAPYTTSKLQQEAYTRLGFPAAKTMRIAQKLYEGVEIGEEGSVGLITYMRTDSVNIAQSAQQEAVAFINGKFGKDFLPASPNVYRSKKEAQEAHEAVRPSSVKREPHLIQSYLDADEYKLYDLIWRKFVASQMTPALDEHNVILIMAGDKYQFKTTGRRNIFPGFTVVYQDLTVAKKASEEESKEKDSESEEETPMLEVPELTQGEILKLHELMGYQHFTKPPGRYNDASLVKILEEKGIGRPSTYAPTIYTLLSREYVNRRGGALIPTELGEIVVELLVQHFPKVMDVEFTAAMEAELDKIEDGEMDWVRVLNDFYTPFETLMVAARAEMQNIRQEVVPTEYTCGVCSKPLVIKWGRFGKFLACSGFPECKYTRSIPTGFRCPQPECNGDLVKRTSKKRRTFYGCSNYPKCNYITNKLPKQEEGISQDEELSETDRETLGP